MEPNIDDRGSILDRMDPERPVTTLASDLIDAFANRREIDFAKEFSVPFPSQVFLTLRGLPLDELPTFLKMKDGIIRPAHVVGEPPDSEAVHAYQREIADSSTGTSTRCSTRARGVATTCSAGSCTSTWTASGSPAPTSSPSAPVPDRRARHGHGIARLLLRLPRRASRRPPRDRRGPGDRPRSRDELLRWETPVSGVARVAVRDTEVGGARSAMAIILGSANTDEAEFPDAFDVRFDRHPNRHLAFGGGIHRCLGSHLARQELRIASREWHRRIPDHSAKPGRTLEYTPAIRSLDPFPMVLEALR